MEEKRARRKDTGCDGNTLSGGTWELGRSGRNGLLQGDGGKVCKFRSLHRETAARGEKTLYNHLEYNIETGAIISKRK